MPPPPTSQVQRMSAAGKGGGLSGTTRGGSGFRDDIWSGRPATSGGVESKKRDEFGETSASLDLGLMRTLPSNIQDSLKVFEELQSQKSHLLTSSAKITSRSPQTTPPINTARSASTGRIPQAALRRGQTRVEKESERKLQIAESVMKKLHKRNQKLTRELADLKEDYDSQQITSASRYNNQQPAAAQDTKIPSLEAKIRLLENQLKNAQHTTHAKPAASHTATMLKRMEDKHAQLQSLYNELLDNKIDAVTNHTATVKINKEVKSFFIALRKKVHSDLLEHEVERQVWNAGMSELEDQLCEQYAAKRMEADAAG
eukprot:TRINITY_DN39870_c0_g1_i1.p1 TRINITY_DN39870_c0_g1~~TRINITY_DN39870_c0_g1_i1.p1  ORF type:complete len:324 (+),score=60.86 TRINITY_DN39870_c0_g1_i1:30-974(+)